MLLFRVGLCLQASREYIEAEQMLRQTLELREEVLGIEHPSALTSMNNVAAALCNQGKYKEAERIYQQVLKRREKVPKKEYADTLMTMNKGNAKGGPFLEGWEERKTKKG
jgi:pentatricopeptide repeat protein